MNKTKAQLIEENEILLVIAASIDATRACAQNRRLGWYAQFKRSKKYVNSVLKTAKTDSNDEEGNNVRRIQDGKQYSKAHSTKEAAKIEAYEMGVVVDWGADFIGDKPGRGLIDRFEIKETTRPGVQE